MSLMDLDKIRREFSTIFRFVVVGLFNTLFGYGIILVCLFWGAGDYVANAIGYAIGIPVAYALHRRLTFRAPGARSPGEVARFALVFLVAYGANLGVLATGRAVGYVESPIVQLLAIGCYAGVQYVLNRLIVFREADTAWDHEN
jgi:putative flippase GtrA